MTEASKDTLRPRFEVAVDGGPAGDAGAREKLSDLARQISALKLTKAALPHMKRGVAYSQAGKFDLAGKAARKAIELDPSLLIGWHLLGIALEKTEDFAGALEAYEKGLTLDPENPPIANDLGRLAMRLGMFPQAEVLFRHYLAHFPNTPESANNLGCVLRNQNRLQEAIDVLKPALQRHPDKVLLWLTLGTVVGDMGDTDSAMAFYQEAIRLDPKNVKARYNLSNMLYAKGQVDEAIEVVRDALKDGELPTDITMMRFALSLFLLSRGDLAEGWEYYRARLEPHYHEPIHFLTTRPRWEPGADIAGRHLMIYGEQGLGDEIMFGGLLPDILRQLGPGGRLTMSVTNRLLTFFQRSFPEVSFGPHATVKHKGHNLRSAPFIEDWADIDMWAPLAEFMAEHRPTVESFPHRPEGFMKPDPARVAHWRRVLSELPGPKVGLLWTSLVINTHRQRFYTGFEQWEPLLRTPGASFINLQYGDRSEDLAMVREKFGVEIFQPPGIDLKNDLDDVAALSSALDLVVGISNATFNIAAACGVPGWLITTPKIWTLLGTDRYPWYSQVKVFQADSYTDWGGVMDRLAGELSDLVAGGTQAAAVG